MLRMYACLTQQHDLRLVLLAGVICLFASYTAFGLLAHADGASRRARMFWLGAAAVVTGGGIWATHFVAMLAFEPNLPVSYDVAATALSVLIAIAVTGVGFTLGARATPGRQVAVWTAGAIIGLGIFCMHYVGMSAIRLPARVHYDFDLVALSLIVGVLFAGLAMRQARVGEGIGSQFTAAALLAGGICGLHFTAMGSVSLIPDPTVAAVAGGLSATWLAAGVAGATLLIAAAALTASGVDRRFAGLAQREAARLRVTVAELERTKAALESTSAHLQGALEAAAAGSQAKSQFLAAMSHELRTPLNAVIGFSEVMEEQVYGPLNARQRECVADIRRAGAHLLGLVNDILDLSRLDASAMILDESLLDAEIMVNDAIGFVVAHAAQSGVAMHVDCPGELPALRADARKLRQILLNLLSNAIKFTPSGGQVRVAARASESGFTFTVADNGIGIADQDIPTALAPFGQVDSRLARRYDGTGLGLPLSKRLIELHGGALSLTSQVGSGTTVSFTFPPERMVARRAAA